MSDNPDDRIAAAEQSIESLIDPGGEARRQEDDRDRLKAKAQRRAFIVSIMQHPEGRVWLKETLDRWHAFETRFAATPGGMRDVEGTFLLAGQQKCGWELWDQLDEADPVLASRLRRGA